MSSLFNRLSAKLTLTTLIFTLSLGVITMTLVVYGFQQTQREAVQRSATGLEAQGRSSLQRLVESEANASSASLQPAIDITRYASQYMVEMEHLGIDFPWDASHLVPGPHGFFFDSNPARRSEVLAKPTFTFNALTQRELISSAALEGLFPTLLKQYSDAVAIYYISPQGILRYYPVIGLIDKLVNPQDSRQDAAFTLVLPSSNPKRETVWMSPYLDDAGQGLLVTASTPVYDGDEFQGAIAVDVSLASIINRLEMIHPTPNSYAFLVDSSGNLVAAPALAQPDLLGPLPTPLADQPPLPLQPDLHSSPNLMLRQAVVDMQAGGSAVAQFDMNGRTVFLAYAPMPNTGWSLALVSPLSEITAQSQTVATSIRSDAQTTVRNTLLVMTVIFLATIIGTATFSNRLLIRPIEALVAGVRDITAGNLKVSIPIQTHDELGMLADSFNQMSYELNKRTEDLAQTGASLREREEQYRSIFESTSDGMIILDLESVIIEANPAACQMNGYTYEEFIGLRPTAFIHPDYDLLMTEFIQRVQAGIPYKIQAVSVRKDGTQFYVEVRGTYILYRGKLQVLAVFRDITDRVQAYQVLEQRVEERTRELSTLLDLSNSLASTLELGPLLSLVLAQLKIMVNYTGAGIFILEGDTFTLADQRGPAPKEAWDLLTALLNDPALKPILMDSRDPVILPIAFGVASTNGYEPQPLEELLADRLEEGSFEGEPSMSRIEPGASGVRSWLWITLKIKDRVIGEIGLNHQLAGYYTPRHARLAMAIANQAAVGIENAHLYERAQDLAVLEERQRLARELHDSVSQALYGIALGARTARTLLDRDPTKVSEPLDYVLSLSDAGLAEMRALIFELRPESLETEGLVAALSKQAAALQARHNIQINTDLCEEPPVSLNLKEAFYRVVQESLQNVIKHAQASQVSLELACRENVLSLDIHDNGQGFDPSQTFPGHLGLRSMRERVERLGGQFIIESTPGQGTRVQAQIPVTEKQHNAKL